VTFDIDSNGILHVTAKEKNTGKEQKVTIQNATNLSEEEVEKMRQDAEVHAEEDKKKKELVEARNHAYSVASEIKKQLGEYGDKLEEADKKNIEEQTQKLEELSQSESATKEELEKASEATLTAAQKIGEAMQKANAAGNESTTASAADSGENGKKSDASEGASGSDKKKGVDGEVQEGEVVDGE
jgi:molecular chaperone DnaK